jgi:hypothetical protein
VVVRQGDASHSERYRRGGAGEEEGQRPGGGRWACLTTTSVTVSVTQGLCQVQEKFDDWSQNKDLRGIVLWLPLINGCFRNLQPTSPRDDEGGRRISAAAQRSLTSSRPPKSDRAATRRV